MLQSKYSIELAQDGVLKKALPFLIYAPVDFKNKLAFALETLEQYYAENQAQLHAEECSSIEKMLDNAELGNAAEMKIAAFNFSQNTFYNNLQKHDFEIKQMKAEMKELERRLSALEKQKITKRSKKVAFEESISEDKLELTEPPAVASAVTEPPAVASAVTEPPAVASAVTEPPETQSSMLKKLQTKKNKVVELLKGTPEVSYTYPQLAEMTGLTVKQVRNAVTGAHGLKAEFTQNIQLKLLPKIGVTCSWVDTPESQD